MSVLTPTIEKDGSFGEIHSKKRDEFHKRTNRPKPALIIEPGQKSVTITYDAFRLKRFGFCIDPNVESGKEPVRVAELDVYVHVDYLPELSDDKRQLEIQKVVMMAAPWLFTYGWREIK